MLPTSKNAIVGSLDDLCLVAVSKNLMTWPESDEILRGKSKYESASRFLEHFSLKIEVDPSFLQEFMKMLENLGTRDARKVLQKMSRWMFDYLFGVACSTMVVLLGCSYNTH